MGGGYLIWVQNLMAIRSERLAPDNCISCMRSIRLFLKINSPLIRLLLTSISRRFCCPIVSSTMHAFFRLSTLRTIKDYTYIYSLILNIPPPIPYTNKLRRVLVSCCQTYQLLLRSQSPLPDTIFFAILLPFS